MCHVNKNNVHMYHVSVNNISIKNEGLKIKIIIIIYKDWKWMKKCKDEKWKKNT